MRRNKCPKKGNEKAKLTEANVQVQARIMPAQNSLLAAFKFLIIIKCAKNIYITSVNPKLIGCQFSSDTILGVWKFLMLASTRKESTKLFVSKHEYRGRGPKIKRLLLDIIIFDSIILPLTSLNKKDGLT